MRRDSNQALQESFLVAKECHQRGDLVGAEAIYSRLLVLDPADSEVLYLLGYLKANKGEMDVGLECLSLAHQLTPDNPQIPYTMGVVLQEAGKLAEAVDAYQKVVAIDRRHVAAWENLSAAFYDQEDYASGLAAAEKVLAFNRESPLAIRAAANCLTALGRRAEALEVLDTGVKYHPALPDLRIHRSWELMANGRFDEAWPELEWRHARRGRADTPPRSVPYPRWNGEPAAGKTILIYGEQGVGDEIMYAPYVLGLVRAGARCVFECDRRLERLFAQAFPDCLIMRRENRDQIPWHSRLPEIDYCISAMSLPLYFSHPLNRGSFLQADSGRTEYWRRRLQESSAGPKIGVSWRGGANAKVRGIRSIPEHIFGELIDAKATYVSLQYGASRAEAAAVAPELLHFSEIDPLTDLDDFVALVAALDAVVSIDNSTVHFAGALGVRTLLLLPVYSEWRWGNQPSGISPWYESLEFIRQKDASEQGWRDLLEEARLWLADNSRLEPETSDGEMPALQKEPAEVISKPIKEGRSALLLGDTNYWYHWGCSCTSLGLHEGLRSRFEEISVLPLPRLLSGCPVPSGVESLDSDDFFRQFSQSCPDIMSAITAVDCVVINGEGSIHGAGPLPLLLLYIAYMAKRRFNKQVAVVNHSCYPGDASTPVGVGGVSDYYARVYSALDLAVVREGLSLANASLFAGKVSLGFDCLPLFLEKHRQQACVRQRKLVFGGSVSWSPAMVNCFADLAKWAADEGYAIEILSGAKAFLASDEIGFVEQMVRALEARKVAHVLHFPPSEMAWLDGIGTAALVVSGRFHYSIAAAFQQVPFLVAESNTLKIAGLLSELEIESALVGLPREQYRSVVEKAKQLLLGGSAGLVEPEHLAEMRRRARLNFSSL
ncbi:MAG: polysaccharide pyruvyl transferase family protein [Propionivibrio sp.]|uniref:tetratricopeptide repeat-containing glycosyltransferase family protein n=1 Tax=Propionivibrio sp. TaxID=2212460 RepID=UPI0025E86022|nr:tetratricopeptide repeat-containing glycosyltransferase family protein [Propionivibrio sp.]MBL0208414.1 polysaccharide pyruvyl transferase family protein [Propionivibrio sp.]